MDFLWIANLAARMSLLSRLFWLGLWRDWPALTGLLFVSIGQTLTLMLLKPDTYNYGLVWMITTPFLIGAQAWAAYEAFRKTCEDFPGTMKRARDLLFLVMAVAIVITTATLFSDLQIAFAKSYLRGIFVSITLAQRYATTTLAIGLILVWLFFRPFPAFRRREVTLNSGFLVMWLSLWAASFWIYNLGGVAQQKLASNLLMGADAICLSVWAVLARRPEPRMVIPKDAATIRDIHEGFDAELQRGEEALRRLRGQ